MEVLSGHHVNRTAPQLIGLVGLLAALEVAAGVGMAYVAGFSAVHRRFAHAHWWWLAPSFAGVVLAFCGYYFAYRGIEVAEDGPELQGRARLAVVTADFAGFLARGGTALDELAMRAGGAGRREAKVRIGALAGFEHGVLALIVCPAAIVALALGVVIPGRTSPGPGPSFRPPRSFSSSCWPSVTAPGCGAAAGESGWRSSSTPATSFTRSSGTRADTGWPWPV